MPKGDNPKSRANLTGAGRFARDPKAASEAGKRSAIVMRTQKENEAIVDAFMNELVEMAFANSTLEEFKVKATQAPSQALRIAALNLANPKTAMDTLSWLIERLKGKPKITTENKVVTDGEPLGIINVVDSRSK